jgi:hypothetical protein
MFNMIQYYMKLNKRYCRAAEGKELEENIDHFLNSILMNEAIQYVIYLN